jgi:hypothetical protein
VDVMNKRCEQPGCTTRPSYGPPGSKKCLWCKTHAPEDYVDVKNKRCKHLNCPTQPIYGPPGSARGQWCRKHAPVGCVDVMNKHCEHPGCPTQACYASQGAKKRQWCQKHAPADCINVVSRRCMHPNCDSKQPKFAPLGSTRGQWCREHAPMGCVDVLHTRCKHLGCNVKNPSFAPAGSTRGQWCQKHMPVDCIDVTHKRCEHPGCEVRCWYGIPGQVATHCARHKEAGMIALPRSTCQECPKQSRQPAIYGLRRPERCALHQRPNDINMVERTCQNCGLPNVLQPKTDLCGYCRAGPRVRLAKQIEVRNVLAMRLPEFPWDLYDRVPKDLRACGDLERPDFFWDCHTYCVILEVDEHQHSGRPLECECTRMVNICQSLGVPTYFIRFNPDSYKPALGQRLVPLKLRYTELLRWLRAALTETPNNVPLESTSSSSCDRPREQMTGTGAWELRLYYDAVEGGLPIGWRPI